MTTGVDLVTGATQVISTIAEINGLNVLNGVNDFYESAFNKLLITLTIVGSLVGVLVPILIQQYQKREFKLNKEFLKNDIEEEVKKREEEINEKINETIKKMEDLIDQKIEKIKDSIDAKAFHLQATAHRNLKNHDLALADYITAASCHLKCNDYLNLGTALDMISESISEVSQEEIDNMKVVKGIDLDNLMKELDDTDDGSRTKIIRQIKQKISRIPPSKKRESTEKSL